MDPLLQSFFRLRVFEYADERQFKWVALDALRTSNVYKQLKLKQPQIQAIERNLVQEHVSPLTFAALCALYRVDVAVLQKTHHYVCGSPLYAIRGVAVQRLKNVHTYEHTPTKPLYALSHYTLADLKEACTKLGLPLGTRAKMYAGLTTRVSEIKN
jgi:hypothetical protein